MSAPILRPTDPALIIDGRRQPKMLGWGIPAPWNAKPLINARSESLSKRATFRPLLSNRCLVPAIAYFEWRHHGGNKLKNRIAFAGGGLFAFAGLWSDDHFTIITCPPAPEIAYIHDRMPVILDERGEESWLNHETPFTEVAPFLVPYSSEPLIAVEEPPPPVDQLDLFGPE